MSLDLSKWGQCLWIPEEDGRSPGAAVAGGGKPANIADDN